MLVSGPTGTSQIPSVSAAGVDDEPDGVGAVERRRRRRKVGAVEPALAVDERGELRLGDERPLAARVHRHVDAEQVAHHERVVGRAIERRVPGDRGDPDQFRVPRRRHDGDGVVVAGVAVEQDRGPRGERLEVPWSSTVMTPSMTARRAGCHGVRGSIRGRVRRLVRGGVRRLLDRGAVPPIAHDPSLITDASTPLTFAYLGADCPDQGTLGRNDIVDQP